jgi:hypothetical protein
MSEARALGPKPLSPEMICAYRGDRFAAVAFLVKGGSQ